MNSVRVKRRAFGLSLVCLIQLASQIGFLDSSSQVNQKVPMKSPCAIRTAGCMSQQANKPNHPSAGKPSRPGGGGYIGGNHYKLTPIDYVDRKLDVYQSRHGTDGNESNNSKQLEQLRPGRESGRETNRTVELAYPNITGQPVAEALHKSLHFVLPDAPSLNQSFFLNATSSLPLKRANKHLMEDIYGDLSKCLPGCFN